MADTSRLPLGIALAAVVVAAAGVGYWMGRGTESAVAPEVGAGSVPAVSASASVSDRSAETMPEDRAPEPDRRVAVAAPEPARSASTHRRADRPRHEAEPRSADGTSPAAEEAPRTPVAEELPVSEQSAALPESPPAPAWIDVTIPEGTEIQVRLAEGVSSQTATIGSQVVGELAEPVVADGRIALPRGARVVGEVHDAHALKKVGGQARLTLEFSTVEVEGHQIPVSAAFARVGKSETGKDAATIAAGALVGTILGNQAKKNDRGKLIGGLIGAGAGAAVAASTEGETIELPAGTVLQLHLKQAVPVSIPDR